MASKLLLVLPFALLTFACSGDDGGSGASGDGDSNSGSQPWNDEPAGVDSSGTISATVDGFATSGSIFFAAYQSRFDIFDVTGLVPDGEGNSDMIGFSIAADVAGVGTFTCGSGEAELGGNFDTEGRFSDGQSCTVTITEFGAVGEPIRGTFSGNVIGSSSGDITTIANGSFDLIRGTSDTSN